MRACLTTTASASDSHVSRSSSNHIADMEEEGATYEYFQSKSAFAAAILGRLALARGANNTITVLVIDFNLVLLN